MLDLESAIRFHTEEAEKMKQHKKVNEIILGTEAYERELQGHTQTAEWLKELAERRKLPEIIRCGECRFNDGTAYCVFHFRDVKNNEYCSWAERRTDE